MLTAIYKLGAEVSIQFLSKFDPAYQNACLTQSVLTMTDDGSGLAHNFVITFWRSLYSF